MQPGDRLIVIFAERREVGEEFTGWLPHITIVPWFRLDIADQELAGRLEVELKSIPKFKVEIGGEAGFGSRGRKLVNLVKLPSPLEEIERRSRSLLKAHQAWLVDETTKKRRTFRPHMTVQPTGRLQKGDSFICDSLYVVTQAGNYKKITAEVPLNG